MWEIKWGQNLQLATQAVSCQCSFVGWFYKCLFYMCYSSGAMQHVLFEVGFYDSFVLLFLLYFFPCSVVSPTLTPEAFDLSIPAFNTDWMHVIHPRHSGYQYPPQKYPRTDLWIPERNTLENSLVMLLFDFKS